jgi:acylphosphatase
MPNVNAPGLKAVHAIVSGEVQGVGFRQATRSTARSLHLLGWVRNVWADGRVEVFLQGEPGAVDRMVDWLWVGPAMATVTGVESEVVAPDRYLQEFLIRQ